MGSADQLHTNIHSRGHLLRGRADSTWQPLTVKLVWVKSILCPLLKHL